MIGINNYRPLPSCVTIDDSFIQGLGLICSKDIPAAECLGVTHIFHEESNRWLRTPLGGFVNHSEHPNCFILNKGKERILYTVKPIKKAEELCVFYTLKENESSK